MGFTKHEIIAEMKRSGLVPLFTHDNAAEALEVVAACHRAGIRTFEFTNRSANAFEVFSHLHRNRASFPGLMLGIGTVMDGPTTQKFIDAGADFVISPILSTDMAPVCHANDRLWIPGCTTLTEIVTATRHGAEVIKVFPGSLLKPDFLNAINPIVPGLRLMVTGGVEATEENLSAWFRAGAMCVGMGSNLFSKEILRNKEWNRITDKVKEALRIIQIVKSTLPA